MAAAAADFFRATAEALMVAPSTSSPSMSVSRYFVGCECVCVTSPNALWQCADARAGGGQPSWSELMGGRYVAQSVGHQEKLVCRFMKILTEERKHNHTTCVIRMAAGTSGCNAHHEQTPDAAHHHARGDPECLVREIEIECDISNTGKVESAAATLPPPARRAEREHEPHNSAHGRHDTLPLKSRSRTIGTSGISASVTKIGVIGWQVRVPCV